MIITKVRTVYNLFKDASNRVGRIDRDLQEVIDCQVYLLDEIIKGNDQQHTKDD
jgi:hypothetical protein